MEKRRGIQEGGMAFGIGVKLLSDIFVACSQPIYLQCRHIVEYKSPMMQLVLLIFRDKTV